jgi:hypothetical protein
VELGRSVVVSPVGRHRGDGRSSSATASSRKDLARPLGAHAWPPIARSCRPSTALARRRRGGAASRGEVSIVLHHLQHERREALVGGAGRRKTRGGSARRWPDLMVNHLHFPVRSHGGTRRRWPTAGPAVVGGICGSGRRPLGRWVMSTHASIPCTQCWASKSRGL